MNLINQSWQYIISRNIPLWTTSLVLVGSLNHYPTYRLPALKQVRIHRGYHSDFYMLANGEGSKWEFADALQENFRQPEYLEFLQNIYKKNCEELLIMAHDITADYDSIQQFFDFYGHCTCMLNITAQASKIITDHTASLFADNPNGSEIILAYGAPQSRVPIQEMERALDDLVGKDIDIRAAAENLVERFGWIPANFVDAPWGIDYFIEQIKNHVLSKSQKNFLPNIKLTDEQKYYLHLIGEITFLNEYRKSIFARVHLIIRPVFDEIAKKMGLESWKDVSLCLHQEILDFLKSGVKPARELILARQKLCLIYNNENDLSIMLGTSYTEKVCVLYGDAAALFEEKFAPKSESRSEVRGMVANKGKVAGIAKIILSSEDFFTFNEGDILIAKMTSMDFIPIMKKSGAFITDEGGLASHAAIIAREYGKPCIIGTKNATKVFKNGEKIEVDAESGVVRKI
ncbi:MAG: hypothetical protein A2821_02600 [Candidatus Magasanikbacteria bacterium RIFCSPHIGHO2_01_FULL_41_23]|uniref:PEP-utilising enzyme mobile domain-containing protein n=1 Tax=Candidatus Magasanikbacteria bacterium RIFCSPLOWO2_01_FULL_40_15 TaxID=1798686 RepID=A0A1F6N2E2_9BACT|nr:MAG: hypothetical protein A2821_02600 [Candidatus Magasanikbacteria bacterium RIFCSPHIGHO2_01_FULL_41_23]OGH66897.1 MAG: hypothetical protein A3C66_02380 [Candidatus Magasanikbacteria bacterium RIFCSPHIGHO2_02_FULL_41_35]OGH74881.1 MAG: hypothetical protein A3F22_04310 [Candidatus Magasanikbacteria bacterium RIFCSPHIGHO2_12_FULL_41_16]OGH78155.1 MAG: hypothetical protein A2983_03725 [Candidatus Magasanikbacteria bacterium RIFCSPLOWO2_01_FULL_40_15]